MKSVASFSRIIAACLGVVLICLLSFRGTLFAEEFKIDVEELIKESQRTSQSVEKLTFVWWLSQPFWELSLSETMQGEQLESVLKVFEPYIILGVVEGTMGPFGGLSILPKNIVGENIFIVKDNGERYPPMADEKVNDDLTNVLLMMKPILTKMLGQFGEGLNFFVFSALDDDNGKLYDVRSEGRLNIIVGSEAFLWKLPLASVFPKKVCPNCKEVLQGNFRYCPWDGTKLEVSPR